MRIGEQEGGAGEFDRRRPATQGYFGVEETLHVWVVVDLVVEWGAEGSRGQCVDGDAGLGEFHGEAAGELDDGAFDGRVPGAASDATRPSALARVRMRP